MNPLQNAVRTGAGRGWTEFKLSLRSPQDQGFYVFMALGILAYLFFNRNSTAEVGGLSVPMINLALPSIMGGLIAFTMVMGPGYALAMEREDGTLLRAKAAPHGLIGQMTGHIINHTLGIVPTFAVILVPAIFLFERALPQGASGWFTFLWVTVLGILATLPIGLALGASVPGVQKMGTWGMLPFLVLVAISGIFTPIQSLWGWLQAVAQAFPIYWLGHGMRMAFLPDSFGAYELTGSWRPGMTVLVLSAWVALGLLVTPRLLSRMARRQSGSAVEAAKAQAMQWVR